MGPPFFIPKRGAGIAVAMFTAPAKMMQMLPKVIGIGGTCHSRQNGHSQQSSGDTHPRSP
jgi:hypothetical protein